MAPIAGPRGRAPKGQNHANCQTSSSPDGCKENGDVISSVVDTLLGDRIISVVYNPSFVKSCFSH